MKPNRTLRACAALLIALMLPLRGTAMTPACGHPDAASPAPQHHCDRARSGVHHTSCGDCCGYTAAAPASIPWTAPRSAAPEIAAAGLGSPPKGILDRLDRPPRFILA